MTTTQTATHALRAETRKLTTLRLPWAVLGLSGAFAVLVGVVNVRLAGPHDVVTLPRLGGSVAQQTWFLAGLVAVLAAAGEFEHRTIRTTYLAVPGRGLVLAAKLTVTGVYAALLAAFGAVVAAAAGWTTAQLGDAPVTGAPARDWAGLLALPLVSAVVAVIAASLGMLSRSTAFAIGALLLWRFVAEGVLPVVLRRPELADWLPSGLGDRVLHPSGWADAGPAATALLGYALVLAVLARLDVGRRDPA